MRYAHSSSTLTGGLLCSFVLISSIFSPTVVADFNAKAVFKYIDSSCTAKLPEINVAGTDMNAMVAAAKASLNAMTNGDGVNEKTFDAFLNKINPEADRKRNAKFVTLKYNKLGASLPVKTLSLYCDGSAMKFVTTEQEGAQKGKPFSKSAGRWHIPADRRPPGTEPLYLDGTNRPDFCKTPKGSPLGGVSSPGLPLVVLCPGAFTQTKQATLQGLQGEAQPNLKRLDDMETPGAVFLHETTHAMVNTKAEEVYGTSDCKELAKNEGGGAAVFNADNLMYFAMASFLNKNDWHNGIALPLPKTPSSVQDTPPTAERRAASSDGDERSASSFISSVIDLVRRRLNPGKPKTSSTPKSAPSKAPASPLPVKSKVAPSPVSAKAASKTLSTKASVPPTNTPASTLASVKSTGSAIRSAAKTGSTTRTSTTTGTRTSTLRSSTATGSFLRDVVGTEALNIFTKPPVPNAASISADDAFLATLYGPASVTSGRRAASSVQGAASSAPTTLLRMVRRI